MTPNKPCLPPDAVAVVARGICCNRAGICLHPGHCGAVDIFGDYAGRAVEAPEAGEVWS